MLSNIFRSTIKTSCVWFIYYRRVNGDKFVLRCRHKAFLFKHELNIRISATEFSKEFIGSLGVTRGIDILSNPFGHFWIKHVPCFLEGSVHIGVQNLSPKVHCNWLKIAKQKKIN